MTFWWRISRSKLKHLSSQFKRTYLQIPHASSLNNIAAYARTGVIEKQFCVTPRRASDFCNNVRFFAAPVQKKQKEDKDKNRHRKNEEITAQFVRLVTDEGHRVISRSEALQRASELKLDLVEVDRSTDPPACKLLDFKKEKYLQHVKKKELAKKKADVTLRNVCKEVRLNRKIESKDLQFKADAVRNLLERGYRVKCMAIATNIDMEDEKLVEFEDQKLGELISRFSALIADVSLLEGEHRTKGKVAAIIVRHVKFGKLKSGRTITMGAKTLAPSVDTSKPIADPILSEENPVPDASPLPPMPETAPFQANSAVPEFLHPGPALGYSSRSSIPSTQERPPLETENRYKKREPNDRFAPRNSMDNRGPGMRDSVRFEPQFPNHRRQQPSDSYVNNRGPGERDSVRFEPQFPNQRRQPPPNSDFNRGQGVRDAASFEPQFPNRGRQLPSDSNYNRNPGMRDSVRFEPQFPNERRQPPPDSNGNGGPGVRDSVRFEPQFPNGRSRSPSDPNTWSR